MIDPDEFREIVGDMLGDNGMTVFSLPILQCGVTYAEETCCNFIVVNMSNDMDPIYFGAQQYFRTTIA